MDSDVARWALEFLLWNSDRVTGTLIKKIIRKTPLSDSDSRFKKIVLLRTLQDEMSTGSITETILDTLEVIEELDRCDGTTITPGMTHAYCAVAVECTVKYLGVSLPNNARYLDAVNRIWRGRICYMEPSASSDGSLLFSSELNRWRADIEAALSDSQVREMLDNMNTRRDAINKLKAYLAEAWASMAPSFIELAASLHRGLRSVKDNLVDGGTSGTSTHASRDCIGTLVELDGHELDRSGLSAQEEAEMQKNHQPRKRKDTTSGGEQLDPSTFCNKNNSPPIPDVRNVPYLLPDAAHMFDNIRSELAMKDMNQGPPIENQSKSADVPDPNVCKSVNNNTEANLNKTSSVHQGDVHQPSLMERNSTARTDEWDDSIDGLPGGTSNYSSRFHLPSPKRKFSSPLKKYEPESLAKRRKPKKWGALEEDTLRTAVHKFGKGNWKLILNSHRNIFEGRTEVDLKDKWRNMTRYGGK